MRTIDRIIYRAYHHKSLKGEVGYIGHSKYGLIYRQANHYREALSGRWSHVFHAALRKYPIDVWIWETLESNFLSDQAMKDAEKKWIRDYQSLANGYNSTSGGDGAPNLSAASRAKISRALQGKPSPRKGVHLADETKQKLRLANIGKQLSLETKRKISAQLIGRHLSDAHKTKIASTRIARHISSPMLGRQHSPATKEKIRHAQQGPKNHHFGKPTWIAGKKHTDVTRQKMREAWVRRKQRKERQ